MSKAAFKYNLTVDARNFLKDIQTLDQRTQHKILGQILRDVGRKVQVKALKERAPQGKTGNLKRSMGLVTGKDKKTPTIFAGPRMARGGIRDGASRFQKGWVVNILENAKPGRRVPKNAPAFKTFTYRGRVYSGMKSVGPIKRKTHLKTTLRGLEFRTIREMSAAVKRVVLKNWHTINT